MPYHWRRCTFWQWVMKLFVVLFYRIRVREAWKETRGSPVGSTLLRPLLLMWSLKKVMPMWLRGCLCLHIYFSIFLQGYLICKISVGERFKYDQTFVLASLPYYCWWKVKKTKKSRGLVATAASHFYPSPWRRSLFARQKTRSPRSFIKSCIFRDVWPRQPRLIM